MKAVGLLIATNLAVMFVFYIFLSIIGVNSSMGLFFIMIYGFAGSFISLLLSKTIAIKTMGVEIIDNPNNEVEQWLIDVVKKQAKQSNIIPPQIGIYHNDAPNAFATGHNKNSALIALSTGLLQSMNKNEVEAVIGHEMAHIYNGDMVSSALIQGVLNSFVLILAKAISSFISKDENNDEHSSPISSFFVYMAVQMILGVFASMIVMWHSRHREFHADKGGAMLAGKQNMISALRRLQNIATEGSLPSEVAAFGIVALGGLFSTHPPIEKRIAELEKLDI